MVMIGFFLRQASSASYMHVVVEGALKGFKVRDAMRRDFVGVPPDISIQNLVDDYVFRHQLDCYPVLEGRELLGLVAVEDIRRISRRLWEATSVGEVMRKGAAGITVGPEDDLAGVLRKSVAMRCGHLPVVDGGEIIGIVSRRDIVEAMRALSEVRE
jgi:predicted transcriptional regulator